MKNSIQQQTKIKTENQIRFMCETCELEIHNPDEGLVGFINTPSEGYCNFRIVHKLHFSPFYSQHGCSINFYKENGGDIELVDFIGVKTIQHLIDIVGDDHRNLNRYEYSKLFNKLNPGGFLESKTTRN